MNTYCNFPIGMSAAVTAPLLLCRLLLDGTIQFDGKKIIIENKFLLIGLYYADYQTEVFFLLLYS